MEPATAARGRPRALRLLSLDGGGIRGISELIILNEIMHRVQKAQKLPSIPLPADYFDLICGTSTGGLIALLLGRLRLSVPEAIDKYRQLAEQVFSEKKSVVKDGKFKASNLERAIKEVVEWKLGKGRAEEKMFTNGDQSCKAFVCAVPAMHVSGEPKLFRTWSADKNPGYNCTIWEAGRATSAAPTFFKRISIGNPGMQEEFFDAGIGCNNPVHYLVQEAQREFGPERDVACIVSIGTGKPKVAGFKAPSLFQRLIPVDLIKVLKAITTDSEAVASVMEARYQHCDGLYHRLNVDKGLEQVSLEEWEKLGEVTTHTIEYLRSEGTSRRLDVIVKSLLGESERTFLLGNLDGSVPAGRLSDFKHFLYPSYKVSHYVERKGPLIRMGRELQAHENVSRPMVFVLSGIGGCGKSQLALEHCYQAERNQNYSAIFWIDATSPITAKQGVTAAAQAMSKPNFNASDDAGNLHFLRTTLSTWHGKWLLVFDNFDDPASFKNKSIKEYFPQQGSGSILITGRHEEAKSLGHYIDISIMSDDEALELLLRRSNVDRSEMNLQEGRKIVDRLGFHALAIDQAGAYILTRSLDTKLFLKHYNHRREKVLSEAPELWDYKRALKDNPETATKLTVFTTWELSFGLITGNETMRKDKEHILTFMAFFDGRQLSDKLFEPYASKHGDWMVSCRKDNKWDEFEFQDILTELRNLSLLQSLQVGTEQTSFSLHPLVQDWIQLRATAESRRSFTKEAIMVLGAFLESWDIQIMPFETKQNTLAHLDAVLANEHEYLDRDSYLNSIEILDSFHRFGFFFEAQGRYMIAEELYRIVAERRKVILGDEHRDTLTTTNNLGTVLESQGKYNEAEIIQRRTLALKEKMFGKEDRDTLQSMNNLALLLDYKGKYSEAEPLSRETVLLKEKVLGKEHPDTLTSMNNLALVLYSQGKYSESESMHRQTLTLREKVLIKEHPSTFMSMNNLALVLKSQGKYAEAVPMYRQTLALREKVLGKEHPDTFMSMHNLASALQSQGKYDEAEPIYRQILVLEGRVLNRDHPDTLTSMNNLAMLLQSQGKYDEAKVMYRRALAGRENVFGQEHPDTLTSLYVLADLLRKENNLEEAEVLFRRELRGAEIFYGRSNSYTMQSINNLAALLGEMGKTKEAEAIRKRLADVDGDPEKEKADCDPEKETADGEPENESPGKDFE